MQVSPKFRKYTEGYAHYCPACDHIHAIRTCAPANNWSFNNDLDKPTFSPSVKVTYPANPEASEEFKEWRTERICHYFLTDGVISYCSDCTHSMAGKTVPLPDLPPDLTDPEFTLRNV